MRVTAAAIVCGLLVFGNVPENAWGFANDGTYQESGENGNPEETAEKSARIIRIHADMKKEYGQQNPDLETGFREILRKCIVSCLTPEEAENNELIEKLLDGVHPSYALPDPGGDDPGQGGEFLTGTIPVHYTFQDMTFPTKTEEDGSAGVRYHFEEEGESVLQVVRSFRPVEGISHWITGLEGFYDHRTGTEGAKYCVIAADCYEVSSGDGPDAIWGKQLTFSGSPGENTHTFYIRDRTDAGGGRISEACRLTVKIQQKEQEDDQYKQETGQKDDQGGQEPGQQDDQREKEPAQQDDQNVVNPREAQDQNGEAAECDQNEMTAELDHDRDAPEMETGDAAGLGQEIQVAESPEYDRRESSVQDPVGLRISETVGMPDKTGSLVAGELAPFYIGGRGIDALRGAYVKQIRGEIRFAGYHTEDVSEEKSELRITRNGVLIGDPVLLRKAACEAASGDGTVSGQEAVRGVPEQYLLPETLFSREGVYRVSFVSRDENGASKDPAENGDGTLVFCVDRTPPVLQAVRIEKKDGLWLCLEAFDTGGVKSVRILQSGRSIFEKSFQKQDLHAAVSVRLSSPFSGARIGIVLEDAAGNVKSAEYLAGADGTLARRRGSAASIDAAKSGNKSETFNRTNAQAGLTARRPDRVSERAALLGIALAAAFLTAGIIRAVRKKKDP